MFPCSIGGLSCGGDDEAGSSDAPFGYLPIDAPIAIELSTDLESDQWQALEDRLLAGPLSPESVGDTLDLGPIPPPTSLEGFLRQATAFTGLSYDEHVEPLLGGELALAQIVSGDEDEDEAGYLAALDTGDGELARMVLEELELTEQGEHEGAAIFADESGYSQVAVDGDVLVLVAGMSPRVLARPRFRRLPWPPRSTASARGPVSKPRHSMRGTSTRKRCSASARISARYVSSRSRSRARARRRSPRSHGSPRSKR